MRPPVDPAGTAAVRQAVLGAWTASPARFREDANAEDDLVSGGYRDRLVVELAQNAVDAAARQGESARLRLVLADGVLSAANTGAPLDAEGVVALSTLRASAKRGGGSVGRFGVGFASVLAVTDAPSVVSRGRGAGLGVRWSGAETAALVRALPELVDELAHRGGHVPVLRLPFPVAPGAAGPPDGFDTEVRLPLRDADADALARRLLAEVDVSLLLALPGLVEVVVEVDGQSRRLAARTDGLDLVVDDDGAVTRWRVVRRGGELAPELLAGRPVEERRRTRWDVAWAVPVDRQGSVLPLPAEVAPVVRAPTPSDDPLSLPAVLVASFPLDPTRRRVAPGPLTSWLAGRAGEVLAELAETLAPGPGVLALVPLGFAAGPVDALVCEAVLTALREAAVFAAAVPDADSDPDPDRDPDPGAGPSAVPARLRGRDAAVLGVAVPALVPLLADAVPGLLPAAYADEVLAARLAVLGVRRLGLADVVGDLAALSRSPSWWRRLYAGIEAALRSGGLRGSDPDALGALPVPLADGRLTTGPRGLLLPEGLDDLPAAGLRLLGLRVVHPAAAHPVLARLGAVVAGPAALLGDPAVQAAVAATLDDADAGEDVTGLADAVLGLVVATGLGVGELPWLADLALADDEGEPAPAGELLLPGSPLAEVVDPDGPLRPVSADLLARHGPEALRAVGVLATFGVARADDVVLDGSLGLDVDAEQEWVAAAAARATGADDLPPSAETVTAVRDLELVRPDAWPRALALLAEPGLREHVVRPLLVRRDDGSAAPVPSYTAWWLSRAPVLGGRRPAELRLHTADRALAGLYDPAPPGLDEELLAALGCVRDLPGVLATPGGAGDLLARLADPGRELPRAALRTVHAALPAAFADAPLLGMPWPERLRAVRAGRVEVVDVDDVLVVDRPDLLPLLGRRALLPVALDRAEDLAWTLDVDRASEAATYEVVSRPHRTLAWADVPGVDLAVARLGLERPPTAVVALHRDLTVTDVDGEDCSVAWRAVEDTDHVDETRAPEALGRALAWRLGAWSRRAAAVEALRAGESAPALAALEAEDDLDQQD